MQPNIRIFSVLISILTLLFMTTPVFGYFSLVSQTARLVGIVKDSQKNAVGQATISIYSLNSKATQLLVANAVSNNEGFFQIDNLPPDDYEIVVQHTNFQTYQANVKVINNKENTLELILSAIEKTNDQKTKETEGLTVSVAVNAAQEAFETPQQMEIVTKNQLKSRPGILLPELLREEPGVILVQGASFYGQVAIRGLTGQRVAALVDGVRFNNSTFATALQPTLGLIDTNSIKQTEIVYGPGSAVYGSDALGGTINVVSENPSFYKKGFEFHGTLGTFFNSASLTGGGNVKISVGNKKFSALFNAFGQRINDLRSGQGIDSHSIVTLYLGLPSKLLGDRLQDTGYLHYGSTAKILYKIANDQQLSFFYQHTTERNTRLYFLLNGGFGTQGANFSPQVLDFFYTRYKKQDLGFLDSLVATFSVNRQRQQFGLQTTVDPISFTEARVNTAYGYALQGTTNIGSTQFLTIGGEFYYERVKDARRLSFLNQQSLIRGIVPNNTRYLNYGAYIQDTVEIIPGKVRLNGGVRYSAFFYKTDSKKNVLDSFGNATVPDLSIRNDDVTFNLEGIVFVKQRLSLIANVTRGFRSPNVVDLGSVGSLPSGVEVLTSEAQALGGFIGTTADATAVSTGRKVSPLRPESLINYEVGAKFQDEHFRSTITFFSGTIDGFINQRTLILPQGAVGKIIGGLPIVSQDPVTGAVTTPVDPRPVIVKANATNVRLYGIELSSQIKLSNQLTLSGNFSYLRGIDKKPATLIPLLGDKVMKRSADIPEIEGGLPPATGFISLRYQSMQKHFWIEAYSNMASFQDRLSSQDLTDVRIGGARSRGDIAFFFFNRAIALGLVGVNRNSVPVLLKTGETLQQVQDRVLGTGVIRSPLFISTPGFATFNLRGGIDLTEHNNVTIILENILDKNYRLHGSGVDAPGINLVVRYSWRF